MFVKFMPSYNIRLFSPKLVYLYFWFKIKIRKTYYFELLINISIIAIEQTTDFNQRSVVFQTFGVEGCVVLGRKQFGCVVIITPVRLWFGLDRKKPPDIRNAYLADGNTFASFGERIRTRKCIIRYHQDAKHGTRKEKYKIGWREILVSRKKIFVQE